METHAKSASGHKDGSLFVAAPEPTVCLEQSTDRLKLQQRPLGGLNSLGRSVVAPPANQNFCPQLVAQHTPGALHHFFHHFAPEFTGAGHQNNQRQAPSYHTGPLSCAWPRLVVARLGTISNFLLAARAHVEHGSTQITRAQLVRVGNSSNLDKSCTDSDKTLRLIRGWHAIWR